jgi:putative SOS response-associated peptidase YedK
VCGRYGASWGVDDLISEYRLDLVDDDARLPADYNVAPTKPVCAVIERRPRDAPEDAPAVRRLVQLRWGLVPFWAKDPSMGSRLINARVETAPTKPAFREAFARRRCLLPADGYYEWRTEEGRKQPYFLRAKSGRGLAMAGLYEFWRDPARDRDDPAAWLATCTILTTSATDAIGHIHDRQPMFVEPAAYGAWLGPHDGDPRALLELLTPAPSGGLEAYAVSPAVNNVRNSGAHLVDPLDDAEPATLF